jgi:hypothetical protein
MFVEKVVGLGTSTGGRYRVVGLGSDLHLGTSGTANAAGSSSTDVGCTDDCRFVDERRGTNYPGADRCFLAAA